MKKRTTNNEQRTIAASSKLQCCKNCRFANRLKGVPEPMYICCHKQDAHRSWWRLDPDDSCINFEPMHINQAEIDRIEKTGAKVIPLTQGKVAIVDADDYERLKQYKWNAQKSGRTYYATTHQKDKIFNMHRLITSAPPHLFVDHINHDGLDNRKSNLRLCTHQQNQRNRRPNRGGTSKYKGVQCCKGRKKFRAVISNNGKRIHLGMFELEVDAAKAYDKKAKELFGRFAYLNFPD